MAGKLSKTEQAILGLVRRQGAVRQSDLRDAGYHHQYIRMLCDKGLLVRVNRGLYEAADADVSEHHSLVLAHKAVPRGTVCLLSALAFHELGVENPHEVWIAIGIRAARPAINYPPLRIFRYSGNALSEGVERHAIERVDVPIYSPAKTVADCFKYRNKIGTDVALEALRECRRQKKATSDQLWYYARVCRVAEVMRPYLEATL
jgi:predicted transcriptional regulator of viral defense system